MFRDKTAPLTHPLSKGHYFSVTPDTISKQENWVKDRPKRSCLVLCIFCVFYCQNHDWHATVSGVKEYATFWRASGLVWSAGQSEVVFTATPNSMAHDNINCGGFRYIMCICCGMPGPPCLSNFVVVLPHILRIMDYYMCIRSSSV